MDNRFAKPTKERVYWLTKITIKQNELDMFKQVIFHRKVAFPIYRLVSPHKIHLNNTTCMQAKDAKKA